MNYPSTKEYKEAILFAEDKLYQLNNLRPVLEDDGNPVMSSGNFAVVFKMKDEETGKLHALKCFTREQEGRAEAYRQIAEELEYVSSTFLTPIKYLDKEFIVDSDFTKETEFPVLLMDWVEGETLDKYIRKHLDDQYELSLLAYQFSRLAMWLMPLPFAHGDLKPDNILVKDDGTLVLVDYDGMYVPAMKGQKARELGSPDFRHPSRTEADFDEHIDDFSLASILLSLKAISLQPSLLEEYGAQDRLLFSEKDYRNLSESRVMDAMKTMMQDAELASLYSLFILALSQNNLSQVSFRLFNLSRPERPYYEEKNISTEVTDEEWENRWTDEYGAYYSKDKKKVLGLDPYVEIYEIKEGTRCIADGAFSDFGAEIDGNYLQELTIPSTVITIGQNPFGFYIKKVICKSPYFEIDNKTLFTKGKGKLIQCYTQESVYYIPEGVEEIGDKAFYGCEVSKIVIPKSVKIIGNNPFAEMALYNKDLTVECNSPFFHVKDNYLIQEQTIISYWGKEKVFEVPLGTQVIGAFAFWVSNLQRIKLPSTITAIGENAFHSQIEYIFVPVGEIQRFKDLLPSYLHDILVEGNLSTEVTEEDLANAWTDEYGVMYSADKKRLLKANNYKRIIRHWSFYEFAEEFGKVINRQIRVPEKGDPFETLSFRHSRENNDPHAAKYVHFSSELGYLSNAELKAQRDNLQIIQHEVDPEILARRIENDYQQETYVLCKKSTLFTYSVMEGTEVICDNAFEKYAFLEKVNLPKTIRFIGSEAFRHCKDLTSIAIPNNLISIGDAAFFGCIRLTSVMIPASVREIGDSVFSECQNLTSVIVDKNNPHYDSRNNCNAIIESRTNTLICGCKRSIIPESVTKIGENAFFDCRELTSINIPNSVIEIGESAFQGCSGLTSIIIPDNVTGISDSTFSDCIKLKNINIPNNVKSIGCLAFYNCSSLTNIIIPENVRSIGRVAFKRCCGLINIVIPESVTNIGPGAFLDCSSLTKIAIFNCAIEIGYNVFNGCSNLKTIYVPIGIKNKFEEMLPEYKDKLVEMGIEEFDVFNTVQTLQNFMKEHGDICDEHWRKRQSDGVLYREVRFDKSPQMKAIVIHQLDSQTLDDLIHNAGNLKVGHFNDGGYAVFRTWVDPSKWEDIDLDL